MVCIIKGIVRTSSWVEIKCMEFRFYNVIQLSYRNTLLSLRKAPDTCCSPWHLWWCQSWCTLSCTCPRLHLPASASRLAGLCWGLVNLWKKAEGMGWEVAWCWAVFDVHWCSLALPEADCFRGCPLSFIFYFHLAPSFPTFSSHPDASGSDPPAPPVMTRGLCACAWGERRHRSEPASPRTAKRLFAKSF